MGGGVSADEVLKDIILELDNDDLGRSFYKRLVSTSPTRLIDFDNPDNNAYHCTAEFTCERDNDSFRPDITLFINGLPLVFIEVKKPYNQGGMVAESERMNKVRFPNKKFRRFINITQLMIFSNNLEYERNGGIVPIQGAFYCTAGRGKVPFNCFREENKAGLKVAPFTQNYPYYDIDPTVEKRIVTDFNNEAIYRTSEWQTNLDINTPTNRILTSMCSRERLLFLLKYGIAYVRIDREIDGKNVQIDEKHIMRYQQMFAALACVKALKNGVKSGIIWHTQGSGKTALSFYLTHILSDYFAKQNKVAKFYFIVDRLDLLEQATYEFEARGLVVKTPSSRNELMREFQTMQAKSGNSGKAEITVINIQRFAEDKEKVSLPPYATNLQRVFIIDEAHRGYNPKGSFLANLLEADRDAVKIALTGTPLLKDERASWKIFGDYLHTYYYDKSIEDGYTLKIIREDIQTSYKEKLSEIYEELEQLVQKRDIKKSDIIEHDSYVKELLRYIINDLKEFRTRQGDETLGGMVICETNEQARKISEYFDVVQSEINTTALVKSHLKAGLILHDSDDKETRKKIIFDFKKTMSVDILIVNNMLLTGFDAPRLKRLYFGRELRHHTLLQALTRVNRPYKDNRYGFVIDFADIKKNFEQTNKEYLRELNRFNDIDEIGENTLLDTFSQIIEDKDTLIAQMQEARQVLFNYSIDNVEEFSKELELVEDKAELLGLKKILIEAKDSYNIVRTFGDDELKKTFAKLKIAKLPAMIAEVAHHIDTINLKEAFLRDDKTRLLINDALAGITFDFHKIGMEELEIKALSSKLQEKWTRTINAFTNSLDPKDPEFITLQEAFAEWFKKRRIVIDSMAHYSECEKKLDDILKRLAILQKRDENLAKKYNDDAKFLRVHKRIAEENKKRASKASSKPNADPIISTYDEEILNVLQTLKSNIDEKVYDRNDILKQDAYFGKTIMQQVIEGLNAIGLHSQTEDKRFIQENIKDQYLGEYEDTYPSMHA